jgi:hypothetical protein
MIALVLLAAVAATPTHKAAAKPQAKAPGVAIHQAGPSGKPTISANGPAAPAPTAPASADGWSPPEAAAARASKSEVRLGEPFEVTVDIKHAPGEQWSLDARQKLEPFALIGQSSTVTTEEAGSAGRRAEAAGRSTNDGKLEVTHLVLKLALFKLDKNAVPDLALLARDRAGGAHQLSLPGPTVKGIAPDLSKDHDKRDIHAPVPVWVPNYRLLWLALGVLAALALAIWAFIWWRRRPKHVRAIPETPAIPADEQALAALTALESEGLPSRGEWKEFHLRLSIVFRMYLARRYAFPALDMTSSELIDELGRRSTDGLRLTDISWICSQGDLAKFAKGQPSPDDCKEALSLVRQLVLKTRLRSNTAPGTPAGATA